MPRKQLDLTAVTADEEIAASQPAQNGTTAAPSPGTGTQTGAGQLLQRLGATGLEDKDAADDPGVVPKKPRGPLVNVLKFNPLNPGKAAVNGQGAGDEVDDDQATDTGTIVKRFTSHRLGEGKTPSATWSSASSGAALRKITQARPRMRAAPPMSPRRDKTGTAK